MQNKTIKTLRLKWKQNYKIITKPAIARRHVAPLHFGGRPEFKSWPVDLFWSIKYVK